MNMETISKMDDGTRFFVQTLVIFALLSVGCSMDMTTGNQCPDRSGALHKNDENLKDFPDIPNVDYCEQLDLDNNELKTLENGHCTMCDFLSANNNELKNLTDKMLHGFPNLKHLRVNYNKIRCADGNFLKEIKRLGLQYNQLEYLRWDHLKQGSRVFLLGNTIPCGCAMKRAVERGVVIETLPICKGHPGIPYENVFSKIKCPRSKEEPMNNHPTTDPEPSHVREAPSSGGSSSVLLGVIATLLVVVLLTCMGLCNREKIGEKIQQTKQRVLRIIEQLPWPGNGGDQRGQAVDNGKMLTAPPNTPSNHDNATVMTPLTIDPVQ